MRKHPLILFASLLIITVASAQDIKKVAEDFEKSMKDPKGFPYGDNKAAGKYYDFRDFKMYCEVYGNGEPLLVIHGNGGSINNFVYQIPYFSKKYKVIIAD